jgi:hypothetical protein
MPDGGERWLRPNARTLLRIFARSVGCIWLLLAIACAVVWWHHGILDDKVALLFVQMAACGALLATLFAIDWLWKRRVAWRVGPEGVAVYRGEKLRRSFGWAEVVSLEVHKAALIARLGSRPFKERLQWPEKEGASWLREYARERLGDRAGGSM